MAQFPAIKGTLESCRTEAELAARPNVVLADVRARPGRRMRSGTETVNARLGGMVVSGRTPDEVETTIIDTVDWFMSGVVVRP
jgi:hypothetical protein